MITVSIARRYAKALLELAAEQNQLEPVGATLDAIAKALDASPELRDVMANPAFSSAVRHAVMGKLLAAVNAAPLAANTLKLLIDRGRSLYIESLARAYKAMLDQRLGRVRAKLTSAVALDVAAVEKIRSQLAVITNKQVSVDSVVDPKILGGVVAQVGSLTYDGSLQTQLDGLKRQLLS
ncbi:MAG: ATP synthase F1 subunit delta [Deltaproteobacteria bacterium]|nr:ATP synthase F1 subunit delta [Deltaproteobacteria bacterium]